MATIDPADHHGDSTVRADGGGETVTKLQRHTFDPAQEVERAQSTDGWAQGMHHARTLLKAADPRLVLIAMHAGDRIQEHRAPGPISIYALSGHMRVTAENRATDLPVGHVLTLQRDAPHAVEALAGSAVLLTVAWPADAGAPQ